ncbi:MAG: uroporphyrinogen decarboxylase family protein [Armatimonadota bacterium]|nr:uroporphyrinogen decarboxylase family protein [Armatimonadota bacterium]
MTPRERIEQAIAGGEVDRIPYCFWYHFRAEPWFPQALHAEYRAPANEATLRAYIDGMSRATYEFWRRYQPDLLKVMHDIPYETPTGFSFVHTVEDWARLPLLEPDKGHFGAQLEMLKRLREMVPPEVPIITTVFNAFYYANKLSEGKLLEHLALAPDAVREGLQTIQANLQLYARLALTVCDGIYYAVNGIGSDAAPREVYAEYFAPLDLALLKAISEGKMNVLHLHGYGELYADLLKDAPAAIVCWSDRATTLSLTEGRRLFDRCVMGGLNELEFAHTSRERVFQQAREAIDSIGKRGFILAPGCSVPTDTNPELLLAIREFAYSTQTA